VQGLDILPVLLQERHQEVHGQVDVLDELLLGHPDIADGHGQTENLLHLELDGGFQVHDLGLQVVTVSDQRRELSGLVKPRPEQSGDLLDQSVRGQESVVLSRQLLHLLLVLVEFLEVVSRHGGDAGSLGLVNVLLISEETDTELLTGNVFQPERRSSVYS